MAFEVKMPQLGLTMEEGTVTTWLKQEGDSVKIGEAILEITTDKLVSEVESEVEGILLKIVAQEGEDIPVKGILAYIGEAGEAVSDTPASVQELKEETKEVSMVTLLPVSSVQEEGRIKVSPLAKKTAAKMEIDLRTVVGSGTGGRIVQKDIFEKAAAIETTIKSTVVTPVVPEAAPVTATGIALMEGDQVVKLAGMRKVVADRMFQSHNEIPCVTQNVKVDVTKLMAFRKQLNEEMGEKYSVNDFILKAVAKALKNNKHILVTLDGDQVIKRAHVNLGMAVALDEGLIVPVIKDADKLSLSEIANTAKDLAIRARENRLSMDEYKGSTFTISNLGMFGVETFTPIVNQPDAGILGICAIQEELAMDDNDKIYRKQVMRISMTLDHRLMDGATAAKFELAVKELLENPMSILL